MRTQLEAAINSLMTNDGKSWFESKEFGRIALNAGFELTVRDRLLENLQLEFQKVDQSHSIVSEFSKHKMGTNLRADMALLKGSLCGRTYTCEGIFEIKTNFSTQFHSDIKKRLESDWNKWGKWVTNKPTNKLCIIYIVVEIDPPKTAGYFPKYTRNNKIEFSEIENHFKNFANKVNGTYSRINNKKFTAHSSYPGCKQFTISSHILVIEN